MNIPDIKLIPCAIVKEKSPCFIAETVFSLVKNFASNTKWKSQKMTVAAIMK